MATQEVSDRPLKDERLVCMIDSPTAEQLERLSLESGAPKSELVRRALASWLRARVSA